MVTGYPSLENAVDALNYGADAYVIKPLNPENLLGLIEKKLVEQSQAGKMTQENVTEWIRTRVRQIEEARDRSADSSSRKRRSEKKTKPRLFYNI